MDLPAEIDVAVENAWLRPEQPLTLPDKTRLVISIRHAAPSPESQAQAKEALHEIRARGLFRTDVWRPSRDELHGPIC